MLDALAKRVEQLSLSSRLADLALFAKEGEAMRTRRIKAALSKLDPGVYLVGAGPYAQGVYSLMCDEVVIGRLATVGESSKDQPVDIFVNDGAAYSPREVSRIHCSIYRKEGTERHDYWIVDRGSRCGTYLNREPVANPSSSASDDLRFASRPLAHGDVISLGKSGINSFVFVDMRVEQ